MITNVLSLFDGISCGQIALNRAGIKYDKYFASEIDKYAIKVTMENYPNTIQLGSVTDVKAEDLPNIDLLIGGSPCQGFSAAGNQLNFKDPRSKLFFEYVRLLKECKPKYFLLENVKMKKEYHDIISSYLGVEPIIINSNLVSAQSRIRYYWTNIPVTELPIDKGLVLKDIVEDGLPSVLTDDWKFIPADQHNSKNGLIFLGGLMKSMHTLRRYDEKFLLSNFKQNNRLYSSEGKSPTLLSRGQKSFYKIENVIRKLTRIEYERLQTVPDGYTNSISNSQAIQALGNGWTVDVIVHIFNSLQDKEV